MTETLLILAMSLCSHYQKVDYHSCLAYIHQRKPKTSDKVLYCFSQYKKFDYATRNCSACIGLRGTGFFGGSEEQKFPKDMKCSDCDDIKKYEKCK